MITILCALLVIWVHGCAVTASDRVKHELNDFYEYDNFTP